MTPLEQNSQRVLDAIQETTVQNVITLYEKGLLKFNHDWNRYQTIQYTLNHLGMSIEESIEWLEYFGVKPGV